MRFCSVVIKEDEYLYINLELLELFVIHYWIQKTMLVIDYSVHNIVDVKHISTCWIYSISQI